MAERTARLDDVLAAAVAEGVVPGLVGIVARAEGEVYVGAQGLAAADDTRAMTADTICWLASMTKLVTSVAAMQLVEAGRLALDAPVADLLPELAAPQVLTGFDAAGRPLLRPARGAITLAHLLCHMSGLGYDAMNPDLLRARGPAGPPAMTSLAALHGPLLFDPGAGWEYGTGIDWAGLAIERRTGVRLDAWLAEAVFAPLGMADTGFDAHVRCPARTASLHVRRPEGGVTAIPQLIGAPADWAFCSGGAGLCGTARDYVRLLRMLLGGGVLDGVRLLAPETVAAMWRLRSGNLAAGRVGAAIAQVLPFDPLPGQAGGWSLLGVVNPADLPGRRRAGSASWAGAGGTTFWLDRARGLCGVLLAQLLPFADPGLAAVQRAFETAAYAG